MKPRDWAVMACAAGPIAALADEVSSYAILRHTLVTTLFTGALAAAGAYVSYRVLVRKIEVFPVDRFVALLGLLLNSFFFLVIVFGFGIPKLFLHPTD